MLSIIIVNFHCTPLIANCLATVERESMGLDYEILIVDNSSDTEGKSFLIQQFPRIQWLDMGYNAGFARANNKGILAAKGDIVLLLNPDTLIRENAITRSADFLRQSDYIAVGVQLQNEDGSPQISGNFAMKGGLNYLLPLPYLGHFFKWLGEKAKVKKPSEKEITAIAEVDWINGAYLMVKNSAIESVGLLDEDFFLYAEEAEWCSRLKKQGKLAILGNLHIIHLQGETANDTFNSEGKGYYNLYDKKGLQIIVSNFLRIRKEFGIFWFLVLLFFYWIDIPIFLIGDIISSIFKRRNPFFRFKKWSGYCINIFRLTALSPRVIANKPHFYKVL